jgi:hypothetical protein
MTLSRLFAAILMLSVMAGAAIALGPHEVLLLINTNVPVSVRIGEAWARLRKVPESNVVRLGLPLLANENGLLPDLSQDEFRRWIWEPVQRVAEEREIAAHILAWVYAPGFPWRVKGESMLSLTGLTFLRGGTVETGAVRQGTFVSPLFAGPNGPGQPALLSRSLDVWTGWMRPEDRPVPGWVLAHVGKNGLTEDEALTMLVRGVDADGVRPAGGVCIVTNQDLRTRIREWQWPDTVAELEKMGHAVFFRSVLPTDGIPLWGLMAGTASFDPTGVRFETGAVADHLTSFGAAFEENGQTKCTAWLRAGAIAAGGTVVEPYAIWTKFPHARLFVHMAQGCTVLESYYQSIRMPLQYLPMGDPLAAPFRPRGEVRLEPIGGEASGVWRVRVVGEDRVPWNRWCLFLDGRFAGEGTLEEPCRLPDRFRAAAVGEIRVVVRSAGLIRHQLFVVRRDSGQDEGRR